MTIRDGRFSKASPIFSASNLVDILGVQALVRPSEIAYTFLADGEREERHLTYSELDRQAKSLGALLQNIGAQGQRALLLYPFGSELEFIAAFFACLYSAVTAVPVYPPARTLNQQLSSQHRPSYQWASVCYLRIPDFDQFAGSLPTKSMISRINGSNQTLVAIP